MRITHRQLTQIIREELLREAEAETDATAVKMPAAAGNAAEGPVHQVDREGKAVAPGAAVSGGLSLQLTVQGLSDVELEAMKKKYDHDDRWGKKFFITLENVSGEEVIFHMRGLLDAAGAPLSGRIASGTGSQGFYSLEVGPGGIRKSVEVGACRESQITADQFWKTNAFYLTMAEITTQANALVEGVDAFPAALIKFVVGAGKDIASSAETEAAVSKTSLALPAGLTASAVKKWQTAVTSAPLRRGAKGPNVKIAQELLEAYFGRGEVEGTGIGDGVNAAVKNAFLKAGVKPRNDIFPLDELINKMTSDSDMGPVTSAAVFAFQEQTGTQIDGTIGKDTAEKLVSFFDLTSTVAEAVVRRWNKLAGLLVD